MEIRIEVRIEVDADGNKWDLGLPGYLQIPNERDHDDP
jgi:hypothetical protein